MATKNNLPIDERKLLPDDALTIDTDDNQIERPNELEAIYSSQVKKACQNDKRFKILVSGKTGSGKSTLVNGILGVTLPDQTIAEEGKSISEPCTTEVTDYHITKGDVEMTVWDSPGLQDSTSLSNDRYLQEIKENCGERDLTLYCIDVRQTRFLQGKDNPGVVAMQTFTREFGWNNTIIVLTCFNCIADDIQIKYLKPDEKRAKVEAKLQEWKDQILKILFDDNIMEIDQQAAENVIIVPAGYYLEPDLPICKFWLSNLWNHCAAAVSTHEGQLAFLKANFNCSKIQFHTKRRKRKSFLYN